MATTREHISYIAKYGLAKPNRYRVVIGLPDALQKKLSEQADEGNLMTDVIGETGVSLVKAYLGTGMEVVRGLDVMCRDAELPGKALLTSETKYNSDYINQPYSITYPETTISFNVSRDFFERNIIDDWMNLIIDPETHHLSYFEEFATTMTITQLDENDNPTHEVELIDCYPSTVNAMPLSNAESDSTHIMTVTFLYRKWKNKQVEEAGLTSKLSQTPLGPYVTPFMSNPAVQKANDFLESQGYDLEGAAVDVYNQIDSIMRNTTGQSTNKSASLLNGIKASLDVNDEVSSDQKGRLIDIIDGTLNSLGS